MSVIYKFFRENLTELSKEEPLYTNSIEEIKESGTFTELLEEFSREEVISLIYSLKKGEKVDTAKARYWAERIEK